MGPLIDQGIYHPDILAYARNSTRWSSDAISQHLVKAYNPLCGDKYEIRFDLEGVIVNPTFHGYGCLLSKASTAVLMDIIEGQTGQQVQDLINEFTEACKGTSSLSRIDRRMVVFLEVQKYPARQDCVLLAWNSLLTKLSGLGKYVNY